MINGKTKEEFIDSIGDVYLYLLYRALYDKRVIDAMDNCSMEVNKDGYIEDKYGNIYYLWEEK